ncbi:hypothetical protein AURDEDRAFT_128959 [Auricularia subglabra TFB-10046 SS5]|nr:hypothetical protein AURDEDRAFT_128959 [Auricularia subglabra TFB-10046 SS5]
MPLTDAQLAASDALVAGLVTSLLAMYDNTPPEHGDDAPLYFYPEETVYSLDVSCDYPKIQWLSVNQGIEMCGGRPMHELVNSINLFHNGTRFIVWDARPLAQFAVEVVEANGFGAVDIVQIDIWTDQVECAASASADDWWGMSQSANPEDCTADFKDKARIEITLSELVA